MAAAAAEEALFAQLNGAFDSDPLMDELGLVLSAAPTEFGDTSGDVGAGGESGAADGGPPFYHNHHKLGIAFYAIPILMRYVSRLFNDMRRRLLDEPGAPVDAILMHQVTRALLLVNADHYTAWAQRRRLITRSVVDEADELRLVNLIFSKHPKSGEAWAHRRWLLGRLGPAYFDAELASCDRFCDVYPRNYYAWTHRRWITDQMSDVGALLERSRQWIAVHVSDFSALHHRETLLVRVADLALLDDEFDTAHRLCRLYPGHESLWQFLRFLWTHFRRLATDDDLLVRRATEMAFADECIRDDDSAFFERQRGYAASYQVWLVQDDVASSDSARRAAIDLCERQRQWCPAHRVFWRRRADQLLNVEYTAR
ncbi:hypothetical protein PBRA_005387 [Plasmodiophora brassicae]|nr:hypothetical protein PBRA_005387 [Plasmodiophora brassicae]